MPDDYDEHDEFDDDDDGEEDEPGPAGSAWPGPWQPPGTYPPGTGRPAGVTARRHGLLLALTAVVAAAAGFGVIAVAVRDVTGSPAAASSSPSAAAPGPDGSAGLPSTGTGLSPRAGGVPSLPAGATLRLEVGGPVTAVSPTAITIGADGSAVTAAVTRATKVTGKVAGISGIKAGDLVSATITGTDGKLTADSIQDPASLPSAPGQ
jgi:hypothetical protein